MDFIKSAEEHELGVEEDVREKGDFVLAVPPYNVRRDRADDHAEYDLFGSNLFQDVVKALEDVKRLRAHAHLFCSALPFSVC